MLNSSLQYPRNRFLQIREHSIQDGNTIRDLYYEREEQPAPGNNLTVTQETNRRYLHYRQCHTKQGERGSGNIIFEKMVSPPPRRDESIGILKPTISVGSFKMPNSTLSSPNSSLIPNIVEYHSNGARYESVGNAKQTDNKDTRTIEQCRSLLDRIGVIVSKEEDGILDPKTELKAIHSELRNLNMNLIDAKSTRSCENEFLAILNNFVTKLRAQGVFNLEDLSKLRRTSSSERIDKNRTEKLSAAAQTLQSVLAYCEQSMTNDESKKDDFHSKQSEEGLFQKSDLEQLRSKCNALEKRTIQYKKIWFEFELSNQYLTDMQMREKDYCARLGQLQTAHQILREKLKAADAVYETETGVEKNIKTATVISPSSTVSSARSLADAFRNALTSSAQVKDIDEPEGYPMKESSNDDDLYGVVDPTLLAQATAQDAAIKTVSTTTTFSEVKSNRWFCTGELMAWLETSVKDLANVLTEFRNVKLLSGAAEVSEMVTSLEEILKSTRTLVTKYQEMHKKSEHHYEKEISKDWVTQGTNNLLAQNKEQNKASSKKRTLRKKSNKKTNNSSECDIQDNQYESTNTSYKSLTPTIRKPDLK